MANPNIMSRFVAPEISATEDRKLAWVREAVQEGTNFLKGQRAYEDVDRSLDLIGGLDDEPVPNSLSNVYSNRIKRQIREVVATLSNLRPLWGYTSDNDEFQSSANNLNKLVYSWWLSTFADRSIRAAMQWACVSTGYIMPVWEPDYWYLGRGDINCMVYGPRDVLPIQLGRDHDLQKAYAVIIQTEVPISRLQAAFPEYMDKIRPDRDSPSWFMNRLRRAMPRFASPVFNAVFGEKEPVQASGPIVDVFDIYILDASINRSLKPIKMGEPGTSHEYMVPFLGQDIPIGHTSGNQIVYRKASPQDCLMFPLRRLITTTRTCVLKDGSSPWWHGKVPLAKFTVDDWPNEYLGFGLIRDVHTLQRSLNRHMRGMDDMVEKALRPDQYYDPQIIPTEQVKRLDPRAPGNRIPVNMSMGEGYKLGEPPVLPNYIPAHIEMIKNEIDHLLAIRDMTNLAKANQIPSAESIDRILEMAGPVVTDISRSMERSLRDLGEMVKCLFYQYYTAPRKVQVLGRDGITEEDWVFEPGAIIPDRLAASDYRDEILPENMRRAKRAKDSCIFHITPNSLHQIQQMSRKLLYIQLWRDQRFPIDPETVAEACDLPSFGRLPQGGSTILERWLAWQELNVQVQLKAQAAVMQQQMAMQAQAGLMQAAALGQAAGAGVNPDGGNGEQPRQGRPPSGQKPPRIEQKDGGTRSTISES